MSQHLLALYVAIHVQFSPLVQAFWMSHASHAISQMSCMLHRGVLYTSDSGQGAPHSFRHLTSFLH